jgi:hypothetical protein
VFVQYDTIQRYREDDAAIEPIILAPSLHDRLGFGLSLRKAFPEIVSGTDEPRRVLIEGWPESVLALVWRVRTIVAHDARDDPEPVLFASDAIALAYERVKAFQKSHL